MRDIGIYDFSRLFDVLNIYLDHRLLRNAILLFYNTHKNNNMLSDKSESFKNIQWRIYTGARYFKVFIFTRQE